MRVVSLQTVLDTHAFTYGILPASSSGTYFAGGTWIGSTLMPMTFGAQRPGHSEDDGSPWEARRLPTCVSLAQGAARIEGDQKVSIGVWRLLTGTVTW